MQQHKKTVAEQLEFANALLQGIRKAVEEMIEEAKLKDEGVVFSENGKIVKIRPGI